MSWLGRSAPRLYGATLARASKIMAPTSCFSGQVHRLPDAPEAYGAMITRAKAAPAQSPSADLSIYSDAALTRNHSSDAAVVIMRAKSLMNCSHFFLCASNSPALI